MLLEVLDAPDAAAVAMLQEASIQAAQKVGMSLSGATTSYGILAAYHEFLRVIVGQDFNLLDAIEAEQNGTPMTVADLMRPGVSEEESRKLAALLKDLKIDL